jgi:hypothetical protein
VGAVAVIVTGTLLHFAYDLSGGSRVVAAFAPANESVWEHLKLVLIPMLALGLVETKWLGDRRRLWWAKLAGVVTASGFIVAFFYTYTGAFGVHSIVVVDILTFVAAIASGQWLSYRIIISPRTPPVPVTVSVVALLLLVALFAVLTFTPPHIPLFQDAVTGSYGPT